jgi:hypothetical protein
MMRRRAKTWTGIVIGTLLAATATWLVYGFGGGERLALPVGSPAAANAEVGSDAATLAPRSTIPSREPAGVASPSHLPRDEGGSSADEAPGELYGALFSAAGTPLAGAWIHLDTPPDPARRPSRVGNSVTDELGRYHMENVRAGAGVIRVALPHGRRPVRHGTPIHAGEVEIVAGERVRRDIVLTGDRVLAGSFSIDEEAATLLLVKLYEPKDSVTPLHVGECQTIDTRHADTMEKLARFVAEGRGTKPDFERMAREEDLDRYDAPDPTLDVFENRTGSFRFMGLAPAVYRVEVCIDSVEPEEDICGLALDVDLRDGDVTLPTRILSLDEFFTFERTLERLRRKDPAAAARLEAAAAGSPEPPRVTLEQQPVETHSEDDG